MAKGQGYGLSARGLAIKTAEPAGEEFPLFRSFWLERPAKGSDVIVVHALLDSPSAAAAFRFTIRPGQQTVFDTEMALYPRTDLAAAGIAPLTSMFLFDANDRTRVDDYRDAVHDSNGLLMWTGKGEQIWRPLANPRELQISAFADSGPRGFGLMQRGRELRRLPGPRGALREAPVAVGRADRRLGRRASSSWWRSRPIARSTTTSSRSGGRTIR